MTNDDTQPTKVDRSQSVENDPAHHARVRQCDGSFSVAYQIVAQLAADDSGLWYRGVRDDDGTDVDVFVLASGDDTVRREVRKRITLASCLTHPAVSRVIDSRLDSADAACLLEPLANELLRQAIECEPRPDAIQRVSMGFQVASAIAAAHRLGLVHGDLSPDSVRVRDNGLPQLDFVRPRPRFRKLAHNEVASGFLPPELRDQAIPQLATDVHALGSLLIWLLTGEDFARDVDRDSWTAGVKQALAESRFGPAHQESLVERIQEARAPEPADRCTASQLAALLRSPSNDSAPGNDGARGNHARTAQGTTVRPAISDAHFDPTIHSDVTYDSDPQEDEARLWPLESIGRFRLLQKLGEGGMGQVFQAEDPTDGSIVAIKILGRRALRGQNAVRRFLKEARMLSEVRSPYVTNLMEVNEEAGQHYIVMEYVSGLDLRETIRSFAPIGERTALTIIADVARGLASAHQRGIIHRDIKPANILIAYDRRHDQPDLQLSDDTAETIRSLRVKLSDFGLARQIEQSESLQLTREGGIVGTPIYMSPEQFSNQAGISFATDIYSLGITLYEMLAGAPPFHAAELSELINLHCHESPPPLRKLAPQVSDAAAEILQRSLAKRPQDRYADAGQLLSAIERLLRGEPTDIAVHPRVPDYRPGEIFQDVFEWELESDATDLWPYVSNTERINCAVGVPAVVYQTARDERGRLRKYGAFRLAGLQIRWEEHPFEWVEGQRLGVLREFDQGPFQWFLSIVELQPRPTGGTRLRHTVRIKPRGLLGRFVAKMEVSIKGKRNLDRVYRRIDRAVRSRSQTSWPSDPFMDAGTLAAASRRRLAQRLDRLAESKIDPEIIESLSRFLSETPAQELARIRPHALARRCSVEPEQMINACLAATKVGLLELQWDILCPTCRVSSSVIDTLQAIKDHAHCEVCDLDFEVDLANSVELVFRAHPEIRAADVGTYCIGGPEHSPHVVFQVRLAAGERVELAPLLSEGEYEIRSAQLSARHRLRVDSTQGTSRTEVVLAAMAVPAELTLLRAGRNEIAVTNDHDAEIVVRLERSILRADVLTAAAAAALPTFRELFPNETPAIGQLMKVATVTLLVVELVDLDQLYSKLGDAGAFSQVKRFESLLAESCEHHSGTSIKEHGAEVVLAFQTPYEVLRAMIGFQQAVAGDPSGRFRFRAAVHQGTALATSTNGRLDYFGRTVHTVRQLVAHARPGELLMTETVAADPLVVTEIQSHQLRSEFVDLPTMGAAGIRCQRLGLTSG